ncbi:MAG TPA: pyruvate dehydrogenase complex dihydrolipoamide acetyltransferase [Arthrobacter sp.]|nr:pyruvate dehydrogenase complex dihydrolipoamide acetyltransferase [Arthrobacter sp.]
MSEVVMPRLSDTMAEGVLSRWLMSEGDAVKKGDVLAEIETDKATMDLEAFEAGVLERQLVPEGASVPIGEPVAIIGDGSGTGGSGGAGSAAGSASGGATPAGSADPTPTAAESAAAAPPQPVEPAPSMAGSPASSTGSSAPSGEADAKRLLMSPLARRIARDHGLDLATVKGTGPGGRIVRADVEAAVEAQGGTALSPGGAPTSGTVSAAAAATGTAAGAASAGVIGGTEAGSSEEIPLSNMRRVTARRLSESAAAPHFFLTNVVYVDRLLSFRSEVNASFADSGTKVSVTDLLVRACAVTLRAHPQINSSWGDDKILRHHHINVGVAVAIDEGLMVPVVKGADTKGLDVISAETRDLAERARAGRLKPDEFSGGTFTISNLGMFGIDNFTAVINPPESAILAVGAAAEEPYVKDGQLRTRKTMKITLTSDHRVLDGAVSAAFLRDLKRTLEEPLRMLL